MPERSRKRPRDPNQLAKFIIDVATGARNDAPLPSDLPGKNPAAVELGRLGGLRGGRARAEKLTAEQRKEIARAAAVARWKKKP